MQEIDPKWASWFRGFFDAEGCFLIHLDGTLHAGIKLREDDKSILDEIQQRIGGSVVFNSTQTERNKGAKRRDCYTWQIRGIDAFSTFVNLESFWTTTFYWEDWFAGFFDGEGHLRVSPNGSLKVAISLREDDKSILDEIQQRIGGLVSFYSRQDMRDKGFKARDQYRWTINGSNAIKTIIPILNERMRTKKALDFEIWKAAAEASLAINDGKPSPLRKPIMLDFKRQLEEARKTGVWNKTLRHESKGSQD